MVSRQIIGEREASSMVSTWREYLCVRNLSEGKAIVEICGYEALAEWEGEDEDGNELPIPDTFDGKPVAGVDDGYLVGGELECYNEEDRQEYDEGTLESLLEWIEKRGFHIDAELEKSVKTALFS